VSAIPVTNEKAPDHRLVKSTDRVFYAGMVILGGSYIVFIIAMLVADAYFISHSDQDIASVLFSEDIQYSIRFSLLSCCITTVLAIWVSVPIAYLMSRHKFFGQSLIDAILDIPIVLPPLVIGLSLLILFRHTPIKILDDAFPIALHKPAVVIAQFSVACAFAVRTLRSTFDEIPLRREQVALTLGCSRSQAFWNVVMPEARRGLLTAATLAWARSLGEFGPILIFAGTTPQRTEVLPVSVHLQNAAGNLDAAVAVSLMMVVIALTVLILFRVVVGGNLTPKLSR
jgi:molybdate transport system permease protein